MARGYSQSRTEAPSYSISDPEQLLRRSKRYFDEQSKVISLQEGKFNQVKGPLYDMVADMPAVEIKDLILQELKTLQGNGFLRTTFPKEIFDGYKIKATTEGKYIPTLNIRAVYPAGHPISVAAEKARNAIDEAFERGGNKQTPEVIKIRKEWKESNEGAAGMTLGNKIKTVIGSFRMSQVANDGSDSSGANFSVPYETVYFTDSTGRTRALPR